jgi:predicted AlkP superfamily phosphohydrolase/phosphomutase
LPAFALRIDAKSRRRDQRIEMSSSRVLVIGLDGVPWSLIRDWAAAGHLPNLARLIAGGASGPLESTMPPTSGPAWSSFATGMNPGKTGIYDFLYRRSGSYVFPPINASMRDGASLWRIASDAQRRVVVVNVPISYPVEPVNGVLVSGWMTPYFATDFTWPAAVGDEIRSVVGDYRIYPAETFSERRKQGFFAACDRLLDMLTETNLHLMRTREWDLFVTVYFDTDRILHQLWHYLDAGHPWRGRGDNADLSEPVRRYFERLDRDVGRLCEQAGPETRVVIMSDHGMGRASRFVVLNNLLLETGFLRLKEDAVTRMKAFAFRRGLTLRNVHRLADRLGIAKHAEYKNVYSFDPLLKKVFLSFDNVDWSRTRAYSFGRHYGAVFLNVRGREPLGCVERGRDYERTRDEIMEAMTSYIDSDLGRPLVGRCLKGEDVYHGARAEEAPDLVLLPVDESDIFYGLSDFGSNRIWDSTYRYSGMHRDRGLLIAAGPGIRPRHSVRAAGITDIAPTCLHWLGLEVPGDMDGHALEEVFADDYRRCHPIRILEPSSKRPTAREERVFSPAEEQEILQRLRDLGYLN